jgi:hypothetical protein
METSGIPMDAPTLDRGRLKSNWAAIKAAVGLAKTLGITEWRARELLDLHRRVYGSYWQLERVDVPGRDLWEDHRDCVALADARHTSCPGRYHLEFPHAGQLQRDASFGVHVCYRAQGRSACLISLCIDSCVGAPQAGSGSRDLAERGHDLPGVLPLGGIDQLVRR